MRNYADEMVICPKCGDDAYEVSTVQPRVAPKDGQQYAWRTKLSCGCTVNRYFVWYDEMGWV